jgi:hypothetical protein
MRRDGALAAGCVQGALSPAVVLQHFETLRQLRYVLAPHASPWLSRIR